MKKILAMLLAVAMIATLFVGTVPAAKADDVVTLKWVTVGSGMPANYDAWKANLNAYLEEKIGVNLEMEVIGWGDWDTRRNLVVTTEPFDIMFTNNGTFYNDVSVGAFADLSDILETAAPELHEFIPDSYWDACKIDGKLYGVPTYKDSSATAYFVYDLTKVEATGLDYAAAHTMQEVTPILKAMYEADKSAVFIMNKGGLDFIYGSRYDDISAGLPAIGVSYAKGTPEVVSVFEQDDVMEDLKTLHEWYKAGYVNSDAATLAEAPSYRPCFVAQGWPAAAKTTWGPNMGVGDQCVAIQWGNTVLSNATVQGSMNCISAGCKNPEKALQLLQLVNTDSKVRDALYFGLEGDNFEYTADGRVHKLNTDWTMAGYTQGTFFNVTLTDDVDFNQWDEVKELNEQAVASPILGFSLNTEAIADDLAACIAIYNEYRPILMTGTQEPEQTVATMLATMRDSGLDDIIAEIQSQIDAWAK